MTGIPFPKVLLETQESCYSPTLDSKSCKTNSWIPVSSISQRTLLPRGPENNSEYIPRMKTWTRKDETFLLKERNCSGSSVKLESSKWKKTKVQESERRLTKPKAGGDSQKQWAQGAQCGYLARFRKPSSRRVRLLQILLLTSNKSTLII